MADDLAEFEQQLQQEEEATKQGEWYDTSRYYQDPDGTWYEFDSTRRAWIPMINEDFIAQYQMNYGVCNDASDPSMSNVTSELTPVDNISLVTPNAEMQQPGVDDAKSDAIKPEHTEEKGKKRKVPPPEPAWFDIQEDKNTNVYVTGLPTDITEAEYLELMNKVGLVASDPITRKLKLKLYKNSNDTYKGDGRCCYLKPESVYLALSILDGSSVRGHTISVERAKFEMKGQYDPTKKKRKLTKQEKKKAEEKQKWLLGWDPEKPKDGRPFWEKVVIIKNAFTVKEMDEDPGILNELTADMREECRKYGDVKKVTVCDRHEDGVVVVKFKIPEEAEACIRAVNGRWFGGRRLEATIWDGQTQYETHETEEEKKARLKKWNDFLNDRNSSSQNAGETVAGQFISSDVAASSAPDANNQDDQFEDKVNTVQESNNPNSSDAGETVAGQFFSSDVAASSAPDANNQDDQFEEKVNTAQESNNPDSSAATKVTDDEDDDTNYQS